MFSIPTAYTGVNISNVNLTVQSTVLPVVTGIAGAVYAWPFYIVDPRAYFLVSPQAYTVRGRAGRRRGQEARRGARFDQHRCAERRGCAA